jgi:hypothetical protein
VSTCPAGYSMCRDRAVQQSAFQLHMSGCTSAAFFACVFAHMQMNVHNCII